MIDLRPILHVLGMLLIPMGLGMLIPCGLEYSYGDPDWQIFLGSSALTLFVGGLLTISTKGFGEDLPKKSAFLLTALAWIMLPAFAALPLAFSGPELSYTDAYFEAMSGLTVTGSTVVSGLDTLAPGFLLWRGILQWLGGIGIIVMAVAVMPFLRIGGMHLLRTEFSGSSEKILPRATQIAGGISLVYLGLSAICFAALLTAGLSPLDAAVHTMATLATGGFSTKDASVAYFDSAVVDAIIIVFMLAGSLPFLLYVQALRGRPLALWRDSQVRVFFGIVSAIVLTVTLWLVATQNMGPTTAFRYAAFNVISIVTTTGFVTADYETWGRFITGLFFLIMFIGGCAGSTAAGIKIFRFQVLYESVMTQIRRIRWPNGVFVPRYNGAPIPANVSDSVASFIVLFAVSFLVISIGLAATGLDMITAFSGAGTALTNVGPGLGGVIGPKGNFASLTDAAKWLLAFAMLLGRLELFTILVLLSPAFWRA